MEKKAAASTCELHKGQKCKYYCTDEKCDKPICQSCITKHQGHKVKPLDIALLEKKKKEEKAKKEGKKEGKKAAPPAKKEEKVAFPTEIKKEEKKALPPEIKKEEKKVVPPKP